MKKSMICGVVVVSIMVVALVAKAGDYTYLDHQRAVNGVMCNEKKCLNTGETASQCESKLNAIAEKNPTNKTVKVSAGKSGACVAELMGTSVDCKNIMEKSISGKCALDALK